MTALGWLRDHLPLRRQSPPIYLHIGAMKTGTTYLQQVLELNKAELAEAGYLFPGRRWAEQTQAAREVLGFKIEDEATRVRTEGKWNMIVQEMLAHEGKASVYSMEFLSYADPERAARIIESFAGREVHVILTVRDAASVLPAQWQTSCRNAGTLSWPQMVRGLRQAVESDAPKNRPGRMFQRTQGIVRMMDVWLPLVGRHRFHVVTVPPRGSDPRLLWERFASVVGVDPDVAQNDTGSRNLSLFGHPTTEFLRRLNVEVRDLVRADYDRVVRDQLRFAMGDRGRDEGPVRLNRRGLALAARWNRQVRRAVKARGVQLVGDLGDLPTKRPDSSTPKKLVEPTTEQILHSAAAARDGLIEVENRYRAKLGQEPTHTDASETTPDRWSGGPDPEVRAVQEVAEMVRECVRLRHLVEGPGTPVAASSATLD